LPGEDAPASQGSPDSDDPPGSFRTDGSAGSIGSLILTVLSLRGTPYRNGGSDPNGFDCSGFTQYVFALHGVTLARDVRDQFQQGQAVDSRELSPGDLVFFRTTDASVSHVAIIVGGDEFVHAPSSSGVVRIERLSAPYWSRRFVGARRVSGI
jgi:cell wall-associated NlpC family hydrolase